MTDECWVFIEDYPNYMVSNHGRVLNWKRGRILSVHPSCCGYAEVQLWKEGVSKNHFCHVLCAKAFVPNPCGYPVVNHIDEDKMNPNYKNLEWVTHQMNIEHSQGKRISLCDPCGNKVGCVNLRAICREHRLNSGALSQMLSN